MADPIKPKRKKKLGLGFRCCSSGIPGSPEHNPKSPSRKPNLSSKPNQALFPPNPPNNNKLGLGLIERYRICSPGRVSPIDSETNSEQAPPESLPENAFPIPDPLPEPEKNPTNSSISSCFYGDLKKGKGFCDVKLSLKGKKGGCLVLDLHSDVLSAKSSFFAMKLLDSRRVSDRFLIDVSDVNDLEVYRSVIELMYVENVSRHLMKAGVSRSIDILEVSSTIMFDIGVKSCFHYLEAVPWSEQEEERLKNLFARCKFGESMAQDVLARLYPQEKADPRRLTHLLQRVTDGTDDGSRKELISLLKSLLSKSSVYQKDPSCLNKDDIYNICNSCLKSLVGLFVEAAGSSSEENQSKETTGPLIGRISKQVANLNWLLEILLEKKIAEEFVRIWADQSELLRMHAEVSPMVRYEISRISASLFLALGKGKVHCEGSLRYGFVSAWFGPMLDDFGWIQRCSKGLDVRMLEEAMGQTLLTLTLKQQQSLFLCWFECFSRHGSECPNLSKAFQIWWRRSFLKAWDFRSR